MNKNHLLICFASIMVGSFFFEHGAYANTSTTQDAAIVEQASFSIPKRLLMLDGDDGSVACRIYGNLMSGTIPRFSDNGTIEFATRSLLRMRNLTAVRGERGSSMVGPADYLGNLEEPHKYLYTIDNQIPPVFYRRPLSNTKEERVLNLIAFDDSIVTVVKARWISGSETQQIEEKKSEYQVKAKDLRQSLFLFPGFLEIDIPVIELNFFDPRDVDLSSFKAQIVRNDIPFQITDKALPSKDDYRLVTYLYEPGYAERQVERGSGLFLEKHDFSQTITPIDEHSHGFVALARTNRNADELELIGVEIPYGWTLIIEDGCIHGDTTLSGFFMMGMTSNHVTMRTADTVFLKHPETRANVRMDLLGGTSSNQEFVAAPRPPHNNMPYVLFYDATADEVELFRSQTEGNNFIFNPLSVGYWMR